MSRYIVIEEKRLEEPTLYLLYKKNILLDKYIKTFLTREEAVKYALKLIENGSNKSSKVVFDSKKDLSLDIHF
jgi:hypothetical protein